MDIDNEEGQLLHPEMPYLPPNALPGYTQLVKELEGRIGIAGLVRWANSPNPLGQRPTGVTSAHGWTIEHMEQVIADYNVPEYQVAPLPPVPVTRTTVHANHVKIPDPPRFTGDKCTLRLVKTWIRQVDLAVKQLQPADPVLYAVNFLDGKAAQWREISLHTRFPGLQNIPWDAFATMLMTHIVPATVQMKALQAFQNMRMRSTVDSYNAEFLMAREELAGLTHIHVPDMTTQTKTYVSGLTQAIRRTMKPHIHEHHVDDLASLMSLAAECEHISHRMGLLDSNLFDEPMANPRGDADQGIDNKRRNNDAPWDGPSKRGRGGRGPGRGGGRGPSSGRGGGAGFANNNAGGSSYGSRSWPNDAFADPSLSPNDLSRLQQNAQYHHQVGTDGKAYPNSAVEDCVLGLQQTAQSVHLMWQ